MCGRFTLTASPELVAEFFEVAEMPPLTPRYNIAPTQPAPVVRWDRRQKQRRMSLLRWGLIPHWADDPSIGYKMINARAETVTTRSVYHTAFKQRRCLVIADGFYEWQKIEGKKPKQPYYICLRDSGLFAFAGLWEHWEGRDGSVIDSCTVLTTHPTEVMKPLHDRMPVILHPKDYRTWLDPDLHEPGPLYALLQPHPVVCLTALPVSTVVNNPANDTPACIEPLRERRRPHA